MRAVVLGLLLMTLGLAGCFGGPSDDPVPIRGDEEALLVMDLPIHIVTVGFHDFDEDRLMMHLFEPDQPFNWGREWTTRLIERPPLQYEVRFIIHEAPQAFAEELFAFMGTVSVQDQPDDFLRQYDRNGEKRVCPAGPVTPISNGGPLEPPCEDIERIDGRAVETWIADNRARHGLDFAAGPDQTIFLLDTYTQGHLAKDNYHQYIVDEFGLRSPYMETGMERVRNYRAWGGAHDFVFLDVGAAPNRFDHRPWHEWDTDWATRTDGPIWEYSDDMETFYENLGRNVMDATRILWARSPIYAFEFAETYVFPMYIFIDTRAHGHHDGPLADILFTDIEAHTDAESIERALAEVLPWAEVEVHIEYVYLPEDDPALAAALDDAKTRSSARDVDFGILKRYFRTHWEEYVPATPGAVVHPTFAFWLDMPSRGLYAYADGDEWGDSWGVFFNAGDLWPCVRPNVPDCPVDEVAPMTDTWWMVWNAVLIHELGHSVGLTHPHDGAYVKEEAVTFLGNWLWDSTDSVMTYRHYHRHFSTFDKELLLRNHAVLLVRDALAATDAPHVREQADAALDAVRRGDYTRGMDLALAAWRGAEAPVGVTAVDLVPGVTTTFSIDIPLGESVGAYPWGSAPWTDFDRVGWGTFPLDIPAEAAAVRIDYREAEAPSHLRWAAYLDVYDSEDEWVVGAYGNGGDSVVLLNLGLCAAGCIGHMVGYAGVGAQYEVDITPLFPA